MATVVNYSLIALLLVCVFSNNEASAWPRCPETLDQGTKEALKSDIGTTLDKFEKLMSLPCDQVSEQLKADPAWYDTVVVAGWTVLYIKGAKQVFRIELKPELATLLGAGTHALISKPVINAIFGSCDQTQRKKAIADAKQFRKNLDDGNLTDQQLIAACKQSSLFHSPLNLFTWKGVRDLVSDKSRIPNGLKYLHGGCDHVDKNRSMECISAVAAHCVKEGHAGGFSQDVPRDSIIELCTKNLISEIVYVNFQALGEQISSCRTVSNLNGPDCNAAAYLICKDKGSLGGIIQTVELSGNVHQVGIMCIRQGHVFEDVTSSDLATALSPDQNRCAAPSDSSNLFCMSTAHRYCVKRGYNGGFMQNTSSSQNFRVLCVEGISVKAPIQ